MESTKNFVAGLKAASEKLNTQLAPEHRTAMEKLFSEKGKTKLTEVHLRVRGEYIRQKTKGFIGRVALNVFKKINWVELISWIIANWSTILKIILMVAPFII